MADVWLCTFANFFVAAMYSGAVMLLTGEVVALTWAGQRFEKKAWCEAFKGGNMQKDLDSTLFLFLACVSPALVFRCFVVTSSLVMKNVEECSITSNAASQSTVECCAYTYRLVDQALTRGWVILYLIGLGVLPSVSVCRVHGL